MKTTLQAVDLFDLPFPQPSRWIPGDQHIRRPIRELLLKWRGHGTSGMAKMAANLVLGLQELGVPHRLLRRAERPRDEAWVGVLQGPIDRCRPILEKHRSVVGPGMLNAAAEWPDLLETTRAQCFIQNCEWAAAMYRPAFGDRVRVWKMGVDHRRCAPSPADPKSRDFLVYDKFRWPGNPAYSDLLDHCLDELRRRGLSFHYLRYGKYPKGGEAAYYDLLRDSRSMLFLCENETQGFAYNEALSFDVPLLAWNLGLWCDPIRFKFGLDGTPATSIPYWDERCGLDFRGASDFAQRLDEFLELRRAGAFHPREYVLENLTLAGGARNYLAICEEALG